MDKEMEKAIIRDVLECNKTRKSEGVNTRSYLLEYKDIINKDYSNSEIIQDINYLDFQLKRENSMLDQLVEKLEKFNTDKYSKKWINKQLDDAAQQLVNVGYLKEYLESVKSSLNLSKEDIDQSAVAKYDEYKYQIDQTKETLVEINKTIRKNNTELDNIEKDIDRLKNDENFDFESETFHYSEEIQKKIDQLKRDSELLENSEVNPKRISSRRNILLYDFSYKKNKEIIEKTKLNSLVPFFPIKIEKSFLGLNSSKKLNATKTFTNLIKSKELNKTTESLFIVILEEDYHEINFDLSEIVGKIRHELNVYLICRSSVLNLIKLPSNRGTLKIKRETTDNYTEWTKIVLSKLSQQELVDEAKSSIPELKRDSITKTINRLESVKDDQLKREEEQENEKQKRENDRIKQKELLLEELKSRKKEIDNEMDNIANVKADKENSLNEKKKHLVDLEPERNAVLEKLKAELDREKTIDPRLYQLESKLNSSIDYLRILYQRRELILNYIGEIKNFIMDQYSNEGFQTIIPQKISNYFSFLRLKPYSE